MLRNAFYRLWNIPICWYKAARMTRWYTAMDNTYVLVHFCIISVYRFEYWHVLCTSEILHAMRPHTYPCTDACVLLSVQRWSHCHVSVQKSDICSYRNLFKVMNSFFFCCGIWCCLSRLVVDSEYSVFYGHIFCIIVLWISTLRQVQKSDIMQATAQTCHDDVIKWKHFPRYWPFPHKGQWCGVLMFSLICAWINGWVKNHAAGDLRRHCTHYDVTVMQEIIAPPISNLINVK